MTRRHADPEDQTKNSFRNRVHDSFRVIRVAQPRVIRVNIPRHQRRPGARPVTAGGLDD